MPLKKEIKPDTLFRFKQFALSQEKCAMKIGTDGVLLAAWANVDRMEQALDVGAGTGVIAIMLAQRSPKAIIHAVEVDEAAYGEAQRNMEACPWPERLMVFLESIQQYSRMTDHRYDLIISNPPFFSGGTFADDNRRSHVRHTIKMPHGDLLRAARGLLSKEGRFCVILPYIEGLRFQELARQYHLYTHKVTEVRSRAGKSVERLLLEFSRKKQSEVIVDQLIIYKEKGRAYTEAYIALTRAFYLKM